MQYSGEIGKNDYAKVWEVNEVLYGLCESCDLTHERETTRWSECWALISVSVWYKKGKRKEEKKILNLISLLKFAKKKKELTR